MAEPYTAKRMMINKRCRGLHDMKERAQALIERVHRIIIGISNSLGARFGVEDIRSPDFYDLLRTMSPCREDNLHRLLKALQDDCRLRLGDLLGDMRRPLDKLEVQLKAMDLDAVQNQLEGEDTPADIMKADALNHMMRGLDSHLVTLHEYRVNFKWMIEEVGDSVAVERAQIMEEIDEAKRKDMTFETLEDLIMFGENHLREHLEGRDIHDLELSVQYFQEVMAGVLPFMGRPVFDTLEMLDECIEAAKIPTLEEESVIEVLEGDVMLY